ncbi:ABC transporter ATP-binding protein [Rhodospirillaceae bacterium KN72]|uniref:ABC transporter ATP-binding protein n=1 Tax=Pacificispira spongiicola TaxID=2729598 RepID=A0A7Y0HDP6_9PROT|nr:ABC transporter ATP-binding protein [Pacificispira spongiicola]NMM44061.1 ABC transporter ATP-binding protein [Pacificispira spongiicola]
MVGLQLDRLTARYGSEEILREVTTPRFPGGQVVGLLGPNAAGKSTLFRRIFGLLKGGGAVCVDGAESSRPIVYMPQDTGANAALTVYESVLLARMQGRRLKVSDEDLDRVDATLAELGISEIAKRELGNLSGGQRQMVGAAQALVQQPEILLLDEPTAALDLNRQIGFLALLKRIARDRGMLILVALHDLGHALRFTDQAMLLQSGRLVDCGPTASVITSDTLWRVYGVKARIEPCSRGVPQLIVEMPD